MMQNVKCIWIFSLRSDIRSMVVGVSDTVTIWDDQNTLCWMCACRSGAKISDSSHVDTNPAIVSGRGSITCICNT